MVEQEVLDCMKDIINTVVKKENNRIAAKKYRENNKEKQKEYYEKNKEKILKQQRQTKIKYRQTPEWAKSNTISKWKTQYGVVCDNFDALYNHYTSTAYCDYCRVELTIGKKITSTTKCLDHCHETGLFRNILCHSCNNKRRQNNF